MSTKYKNILDFNKTYNMNPNAHTYWNDSKVECATCT